MDPVAVVSKTVEAPPRAEAPKAEPAASTSGEGRFPRALDERVDAAQKRTAEERSANSESPGKAETQETETPTRPAAKQVARDADEAREERGGETSDATLEAGDLASAVAAELVSQPMEPGDESGDTIEKTGSDLDPESDQTLEIPLDLTKDAPAAPAHDPADKGMADSELLAVAASSATEVQAPAPQRAAKAAPPKGGEGRTRVEPQAGGEPPREAARAPEPASPPTSTPGEAPASDSSTRNHSAHDRQPPVQARAEAQVIAPAGPGDPSPAQATAAQTLQLPPAIAAAGAAPAAATTPSASASASTERSLPELPVRNENEIVQTARMLARQNGGEARIVLHPPQLGELGVRLIVTHDVARLALTAEHQGVAQLLARHLPELRAALDAHGIRLERVDVDVRGDADGGFGRASQRGAPDEDEAGGYGPRGRLRAGTGQGGSVLPPLRGMTPPWAHLGTVDLRI